MFLARILRITTSALLGAAGAWAADPAPVSRVDRFRVSKTGGETA